MSHFFLYFFVKFFIRELIFVVSNYYQFTPNPENIFIDIFQKGEDNYITGRSITNYRKHLFPDIKTNNKLIETFNNKKYLDLGCGLNYLLSTSLLYNINKKYKNVWAKGLDIYKLKKHPTFINKSLFDTQLKSSSIDIITVQFVLYSHIKNVNLLKKAFTEIHRILKKNGEIIIYPIYYGNYFLGNDNFKKWLNRRFKIEIINPLFDVDNNKKLDIKDCNKDEKICYKNFSDSYIMEWTRHNILNVKTVIFTKI